MSTQELSTSAQLAAAERQLAAYAKRLDHADRSLRALEAVMEDDPVVVLALVDAMSTDELKDLQGHANALAKAVRTEWLNRTRQPAGGR